MILRLIGYGAPLLASFTLFAQSDVGGGIPWEKMSALVILGAVAIFHVTKTLPSMTAAHEQTVRELTQSFQTAVTTLAGDFRETIQMAFQKLDTQQSQSNAAIRELADAMRDLTANCAVVHAHHKE